MSSPSRRHGRDRRGHRRRAGDRPGHGAVHRRAHLPQLSPVRHAPEPDRRRRCRGARRWPIGTQAAPGLAIYRFGSGLYYANATRFTEEIMDVVEDADPPLQWLASPARPSATSTIPAPTRSARSGASCPPQGRHARPMCDMRPDGPHAARRVRPDRPEIGPGTLLRTSDPGRRDGIPQAGRPPATAAVGDLTAERVHDHDSDARRTCPRSAERRGRGYPGAHASVGGRRRPTDPVRCPARAGDDPRPGAGADPPRADGGFAVRLLPGRRAADGRGPCADAGRAASRSSSVATLICRTSGCSPRPSGTPVFAARWTTTSTPADTFRMNCSSRMLPTKSSSFPVDASCNVLTARSLNGSILSQVRTSSHG